MGWTRAQWGVAATFFADAYGWLPMPTIDGANKVMAGWWNRHCDEPSGEALLVDERGRPMPLHNNPKWVLRLIRHAALECHVLPFKEAFIGEEKRRCRSS